MRTLGIAAALVLLTCTRPARAESAWFQPPQWGDVALLGVAEALIVVDVLQTLDLKHHPDAVFGEMNPLLGQHPSDARIIGMGALGALVTAGAWYALPSEGRWVAPAVVIVLETFAVVGNARAGMVIRF